MPSSSGKKPAKGRRPLSASVLDSGNAKQRCHTTLADKIMILAFIEDNPKLSQSQVASHFQKKGFPTINQSTISRIVKNAEKHHADAKESQNLTFKRQRVVEHPEIEEALWEWTLQAQTKGIKITGEVLREKGRRFAKLLGLRDEEFLSLSNGWLDSFKECHGLKHYRFHGEAGSVSECDAEAARVDLRKITDQYALKDILNMDETGLNDRMPPDRGLATAQFSGKKADKHRLTFALTTNADGSERFPPLIIGHAQRPRCFQKKSGVDLGFDYHWNKKAWMTAKIFQDWLGRLDRKMRKAKRKVLLLIDNAPSHIFDEKSLTNVTVAYLPPNMTLKLQPMDGGIIRTFKANFKQGFCMRAIDRDEAGEVDIYKIDQLQSMRLAQEAWDKLTAKTVANCWRHVGILSSRDASGAVLPDAQPSPLAPKSIPDPAHATIAQLDKTIKKLAKRSIAPVHVMDAEEMLAFGEDGETEGSLDDEEILAQILRDKAVAEGEEIEDEEVEETPKPTISVTEGIRYLRALAPLFDVHEGPEFREASRLLPKLIRALNLEAHSGMEQRRVTDYFFEWPQSP